jgi:UDP-N-acetyl-D-mannosaminuronic acid transferase (WecB/TagA/CpsF family)
MLHEIIVKKTSRFIVAIAANENKTIDKVKAEAAFQASYKTKIPDIIKTLQSDANEADIMQGIENGQIHSLVKQAALISLDHSCMVWAKEIINQS